MTLSPHAKAEFVPAAEPTVAATVAPLPRGRLFRWNEHTISWAWVLLAATVVLGTQVPSAMWAFMNPTPDSWDEADYLNLAHQDTQAYRDGGLPGLYRSLISLDVYRPPAYRIASAPFLFVGTPLLPTLRAVSILFFLATLYLIYRTGAAAIPGPAGRAAGAVAVVLATIYTAVGRSTRMYGTEYTLYFAIALVVYCVVRAARPVPPGGAQRPHWTWIALGFGLGLGMLAKLSFALLGVPAAVAVLALVIIGALPALSLLRWLGACAIATFVCLPYYSSHFPTAKLYGQSMIGFERHSLHRRGWALLMAWVQLQFKEGMGLRRSRTRESTHIRRDARDHAAPAHAGASSVVVADALTPAGVAVIVSLAMALPLPAFQLLFSVNNNVRHVSPSYLPLAIAAGVAAAATGLLTNWWSWAVLILVAVGSLQQVNQDFLPMPNFTHDVWDWEPLYAECQRHGVAHPRIGHVGNGSYFTDPALVYPWRRRGDSIATSKWLWRAELADDVDWDKLMRKVGDYDVIVTANPIDLPAEHSMLPEPTAGDNAHNAEFAQRMLDDRRFTGPAQFMIGQQHKAEIWVFFRKPTGEIGDTATTTPTSRPSAQ